MFRLENDIVSRKQLQTAMRDQALEQVRDEIEEQVRQLQTEYNKLSYAMYKKEADMDRRGINADRDHSELQAQPLSDEPVTEVSDDEVEEEGSWEEYSDEEEYDDEEEEYDDEEEDYDDEEEYDDE